MWLGMRQEDSIVPVYYMLYLRGGGGGGGGAFYSPVLEARFA